MPKKRVFKRSKKSTPQKKRAQKRRFSSSPSLWGRFWKWSFILGIWGVLLTGGALLWFLHDLPDISTLQHGVRRPSIVFLTQDNQEIAHYGDLYGEPVQLTAIPPYVVQAILAIEDKDFYAHKGVSWWGILRAAVANMRAGGVVQGGSTITQQIAKNVFLEPTRSLKRKIQELLLSFWLEFHFTKEQLLTIYLNRVYLGAGVYGVDAASQEYFGVPVTRITLPEAAVLAGLLKAPSRLAPSRNPALAKERGHLVARRMHETGFIDERVFTRTQREITALTFEHASQKNQARYFTDWVMHELQKIGVRFDQDLIVVTTLDLALQARAENAVQEIMATATAKDNAHQAALVALDYEGGVRALVGGVAYFQSMFNRAVQAKRQIGSTFKLFVYLAALEAGIPPDQLFADGVGAYQGWAPKNFGWRERGQVSLLDGFVYSINTVAVRVADLVGAKKIIATAQSLGMKEHIPNDLSIALGSSSGTLLQLTNAYAIIANGGKKIEPYGVLTIYDASGNILYKRDAHQNAPYVVSPEVAQQMQKFLQQAVERGTGKNAKMPGVTLGGKTGTSQKHRDAWFIGIAPHLVAGVWVGNDDEAPMRRVTGAKYPVQIWRRFFQQAQKQ